MTDESISTQPYLIRALWQWAIDSGMTPQLLVDATQAGVQVPASSIQDGQVVLNISDRAVANLELGNDAIHFSTRFGGVARAISVPVAAVRAIFTRENGQGMVFESVPAEVQQNAVFESSNATVDAPPARVSGKPQFTVIK